MGNRHPLPRRWLMTDPRLGELEPVIRRLPPGTGVVFRHYELETSARRALFALVRRIARKRRLVLLLAASPEVARRWGADGAHDRSPMRSQGLRTAAVHDVRERIAARRVRADLIFISPVLPTRSHPGARHLAVVRAGYIAGPMRHQAIALGGMNAHHARAIRALGFHGWAGIDAFRI